MKKIALAYLMDQAIRLLGQTVSTCFYIKRFKILISRVSNKSRVEMMLKENAQALREKEEILFGPKFEEVETKSFTLKNKPRDLFGNSKNEGS